MSYSYGVKEHKSPRPLPLMKQYKYGLRDFKVAFQRSENFLEDRLYAELVDLVERRSKVLKWRATFSIIGLTCSIVETLIKGSAPPPS